MDGMISDMEWNNGTLEHDPFADARP
jgi:hypothetical protein